VFILKLEYIQAGSFDGIDTHDTVYFRKIWKQLPSMLESPAKVLVDPFARNCTLAHPHTNDIDENTTARHHLDALEYLQGVPSNFADLVIFDPPFSPSQEKKYKGNRNVYATPGYIPALMSEIKRILKPGGYLLKFGYNFSRHWEQLQPVKGWVANPGGNRNAVLISLWRTYPGSLLDWTN
jgi:hypothetical protein